jgi:hypothetical protein
MEESREHLPLYADYIPNLHLNYASLVAVEIQLILKTRTPVNIKELCTLTALTAAVGTLHLGRSRFKTAIVEIKCTSYIKY